MPKSNADFHKRKAKVGKKIERNNVTKISVKSRKIQVSEQRIGQSGDGADPRQHLDRLLRALQHHSSASRLQSVRSLIDFFAKSEGSHLFVTLAMPGILEVLFDEDASVRSQLLSLLNILFSKHGSDVLASVAPVLVTYMSNGLTSLNTAVRADSLRALYALVLQHSSLLCPYAGRLVGHIITLLASSAKLGRSIDKLSAEKKMELGIGKRGGKGKNCASDNAIAVGGAAKVAKKAEEKEKKRKTGKMGGSVGSDSGLGSGSGSARPAEKKEAVSMMMTILLLLLRARRLEVPGDGGKPTSCGRKNVSTSLPLGVTGVFIGNARPRMASCLKEKASGSGDESSFLEMLRLLCETLSHTWTGLEDDGAIDVGRLELAQDVLRVSHELAFHTVLASNEATSESFYKLIRPMLRYIPCTLKDADRIAPGSAKQGYATKNIELVNQLISEIALLLPSQQAGNLQVEDGAAAKGDTLGWQAQAQTIVSCTLLSMLSKHCGDLEAHFASLQESEGEHGLSQLAAAQKGVLQVVHVAERTLRRRPSKTAEGSPLAQFVLDLPAPLAKVLKLLRRRSELSAESAPRIWAHTLGGLVSPTVSLLTMLCELTIASPEDVGAHACASVHDALVSAANVCLDVPDAPVGMVLRALHLFVARTATRVEPSSTFNLGDISRLALDMLQPGFFFGHCSDAERIQVLDLWSVVPFDDVRSAAKTALMTLCDIAYAEHSGTENTNKLIRNPCVYFARLLYERRGEIGPSAAIDLTLQGLDWCIESGAKETTSAATVSVDEPDVWLMVTNKDNFIPVLTLLLARLVRDVDHGDDVDLKPNERIIQWLSREQKSQGNDSGCTRYWKCVTSHWLGQHLSLLGSGADAVGGAICEKVVAFVTHVDVPGLCNLWKRPGLASRLLRPLAMTQGVMTHLGTLSAQVGADGASWSPTIDNNLAAIKVAMG